MDEQDSKWLSRDIARTYLDGVRGAIPGAELQLEVIRKIVDEWCPAPSRILDLGCGDGILGRMLLDGYPTAQVIFVDFSEPMVERVLNLIGPNERAAVIKRDFSTPAWTEGLEPERSFDIVLSGFAIHHQPDGRKRELYAEIYGLLGEGGMFLNLDQVSSATPSINTLFDGFFLDRMRRFHDEARPDISMEAIEKAFCQDKKENLPAPVEVQCRWLRDIGFRDVDCFFKVLELALFGGRK